MQLIKTILFYFYSLLPLNPRNLQNIHKVPYGFYIYIKNYFKYKKINKSSRFKIYFKNSRPSLYDRFDFGGNLSKHYFHQDLWAAKKLFETNPMEHYDIGSRLDGFISHCLLFTNVVMFDIRPIKSNIENLKIVQANAMNMSNITTNSIDSISSLHAVEHVGLARYGDPIDPDGYIKAIKEIQRVASYNIYFSVPIGKERLVFDSHRIFNPKTVVDLFNECELIEFSAIDDTNTLQKNANFKECNDFDYGCGLFHFRKDKNV